MNRARPFILVLLAALTAGCAGRSAVPFPDPERQTDVLTGAEITTIARILRYEDHREFDTAGFWAALIGAPTEVRRRVAASAGRIGDPAAAPLLIELLETDPDYAVRADAAFALGALGVDDPAILAALRQAAPDGWIPVRWEQVPIAVEVLAALGKIGGDEARTMVHDALRKLHPGGNARLRSVAAEALLTVWKFDGAEGNVLAAAPYLSQENDALRWRAAYALMRGGHPSALPHLLALEQDPDHRVRAVTARALIAANADAAGVADRAVDWLAGALVDPHPHVRTNALRSLGGYGERAPLAAMAAHLEDPDRNVGVAAAAALGELGPRARDVLASALEDSRLPLPLRGEILVQLTRAAQAAGTDAASEWAAAGPRERYFAARALPFVARPQALSLATRLAADEDVRVAVAALGAVPAIVGDTVGPVRDVARLREVVLEAGLASDPTRRAAAFTALGPLATVDDAALIVEGYRLSTGRVDQDPAARGAAIAAIELLAVLHDAETRAREADSASTPAVDSATVAAVPLAEADAGAVVVTSRRARGVADLLFDLPAPVDPWTRSAAAALGDGWGPPPRPGLGEALALYDVIVRRYVAEPLSEGRLPRVTLETRHGSIVIELLSTEAPLTVYNFLTLAGSGFYDDGVWHRVVPNFVLQDGAPHGFAAGGPGWTIRDEINRIRYDRGMVGMALSGPDTGGSQWFITHSPQPHLDGGYTIFGRVIEGMDVADAVLQGEPIFSVRVGR